ncbi:hypothetical protein LZ554_001197 [Drepanopeziza brunnea f. sp. 'monogermtubi']|nr:hypothetical protein LZ554_001197 [Drepanopeziza brunnea f. sp. 'monogermtubi']
MSIQPLPPDVVAQIKSSIIITSLNGVVRELVKNSLDAGATKIEICLDYGHGGCSVEDDGLGILPSEFSADGHLGKLHYSSKLNHAPDQDPRPLHGGHGRFLAALAALSVVSITSHHHLHRSHNALTMHRSAVVARQVPAPAQQHLTHPGHGTRVVVRDLFGNMPVRVKQRAVMVAAKEWADLKRDVVALLLPWGKAVAVTMTMISPSSSSNPKMVIRPPSPLFTSDRFFSVSSVSRTLSQAAFISVREADATRWVPVGASTPMLRIAGLFSLDPGPTKQVQFLSLGIQPLVVGQNVFHDEINRLFSHSAFGVEEEAREPERERFTNKELKGAKKGVDRWPMFCLNIQLQGHEQASPPPLPDDDVLDDTGPRGRMIKELLQATVREFLTTHHFRPTAAGAGARAGFRAHHQSEKQVQVQVPEHRPRRESKSKSKSQFPFHSNALGTNVRMPSFRHGTTAAASSDSRLDQTRWSIVKRGMAWSRGPKLPEPEPEPAQMAEDVPIVRPATSLPLAAPGATTLLSQDGKIVRAPFALGHVLAARPPQDHPSPSPSSVLRTSPPLSRDVCADEDARDEMAVYINPVTKVTSFVNQRTGLVVKPNSSNSRDRSFPKRFLLPPKPPTSSGAGPSLWISDILKNWENPIFQPPEASIPHVAFEGASTTTQNILHGRHHHCSQLDIDRAFRESASGIAGRVSKEALKHAEVVSQVDMKFILVKLRSFPSRDNNMLVLVDQHAADERIRVETLMEELCTPESSDSGVSAGSSILSSCLDKPLHFEISPKEIQLLIAHRSHFANWGILYSFSSLEPESLCQRLTVHSLPPGISERCKLEPRLLIDLLRAEVYKVHDAGRSSAASLASENWLQKIHGCPQGILDLLNSRACRSAIMFNDVLSRAQCEILVGRLAGCAFPFQCAHGRPSLVPLVDVGGLRLGGEVMDAEGGDSGGGGGGGFGARFRRWKEGGVCV